MYQLREERDMKPVTFANVTSALLYEKRFGSYFASPVIAGLDDNNVPYLCGTDSIGAMETAKDFMLAGMACSRLPRVQQRLITCAHVVHTHGSAKAVECFS